MIKGLFYIFFIFVMSGLNGKTAEIAISVKPMDHEALIAYNFSSTKLDRYQKALEDSLRIFFSNLKTGFNVEIMQTFERNLQPYYAFTSKPALTDSTRHKLQKKLMSVDPIYARFLPYTFNISLNINGGCAKRGLPFYPVLENPTKTRFRPYQSSDLKGRFDFIQKWLKEGTIPLLAEILSEKPAVMDVTFGASEIDAQHLFSLLGQTQVLSNGFIENYPENPQLIPTLKVMLLSVEGRFDYALTYMAMIYNFEESSTLLRYLLDQLNERLSYYKAEENRLVELAKQLDKAEKESCLDSLLAINSQSTMVLYERLDKEKNPMVDNSRLLVAEIRAKYFASNPISRIRLIPFTKKETYQNHLLEKAENMFIDAESFHTDFPIYAEMALELEAYEFANDLYWMLWIASESTIKEYEIRHDYAFGKSVEPNIDILAQNKKKFKRLDKKLRKKMKKNPAYNQFK